MNEHRIQFLDRFEKEATKNNYLKSFKKLDEFLISKGITEGEYLSQLKEVETFQKYKLLQELVTSIKDNVSPKVVRLYFDSLFKYFLIIGIPLDYTQKRLRVVFPRSTTRRFEGLDKEKILRLLQIATKPNDENNLGGRESFTVYMKTLVGSGMRETEGLLIKPRMIKFDEFPPRLMIPGEIAKFNIERETFLPPSTAKTIKELIEKKNVGPDQTIFTLNWNVKTLEDYEKYFARIRRKAGYDTPDRKKYQQNDITLHSFRSYFITTFTDHKLESFGHALAGHTKDLSVYYRKSLKERQTLYAQVMSDLEF